MQQWRNGSYPSQASIATYSSSQLLYDAGNFDACRLTEHAHYCRVQLPLDKSGTIAHIGVCAPRTCTGSQLALVNTSSAISPLVSLFSASPVVSHILQTALDEQLPPGVVCTDEEVSFWQDAGAVGCTVLLVSLAILVAIASLLHWRRMRTSKQAPSPLNSEAALNHQSFHEPLLSEALKPKQERSLASRILECFALSTTWQALYRDPKVKLEAITPTRRNQAALLHLQPEPYRRNTSEQLESVPFSEPRNNYSCSPSLRGNSPVQHIEELPQLKLDFSALHGLRVGSLIVIIVSHVSGIGSFTWSNMLTAYAHDVVTSFWFQGTTADLYAVDTFLLLSALLASFFLLQTYDVCNGALACSQWCAYYAHRYLRLTPIYGLWILLQLYFFTPMTAAGPLSDQNAFNDGCGELWWSNLLYVNNFVGTLSRGCITWSWYLAVDWQIYCLLPIPVIVFRRSRRMGYLMLLTIAGASIALRWALCAYWHFRFDYWQVLLLKNSSSPPPATSGDYWNDVYTKPYTRCIPSVLGVALAFLLKDGPRFRMPLALNWVLSSLAYVVLFVLVFVLNYSANQLTPDPWSDASMAAVLALGSTLWSVSIAFLVFTWVTGQGGMVEWILRRPCFVPLGKLSYQVYLLHPQLVIVLIFSASTYGTWSTMHFLFTAAGTILLSFGLAFVGYMIAEHGDGDRENAW